MKGQVGFILLYAVGFSFSLTMEDTMQDPGEELEQLLENVQDENKACRDLSRYWCTGYSSRCSQPNVQRYCPETCGRCPGGGWGTWSGYGPCSKSCHHGYQTRKRKCNSPSTCEGPFEERRKCNVHVRCPGSKVGSISALNSGEGTWTPWSSFTPCSKSCGTGTQSRNRTCINPSNTWRCPGPFRQHQPCNQHPCAVDGGWTSWGSFRQCSVSCGGGKQYKYRKCKNPPPQHGGKTCSGIFTMSRDCNTHPCAVNGHWSHWSGFGQCSKTCGGGIQYRRRACTNPAPSSGGKSCHGPAHQSNACNTQSCAVHGNWSPWSAFGHCSRSCGGGMKYKTRKCNNPAPSSGGHTCQGPSQEMMECNTHACPVDGQWSQWSVFGSCSQTCGGGFKRRSRKCDNPAPSSGGKHCPGPSFQSVACHVLGCPVHGHWSSWSSYGPCSKTCGGGAQYRRRACNNPAPFGGGKGCPGPSYHSRSCNTKGCPVDGHWSHWSGFGQCSKTCGGGIQYRRRACTNPAPSSGGKSCHGPVHQSHACNTQSCAVHGNWSPWSAFGHCSRSCGGGMKYKTRKCDNPAPSSGGHTCQGPSKEMMECNTHACPVHGHWSSWSSFGSCSKSCGGGAQYRRRTCSNPAPSGGGKGCPGSSYHSRACNTKGCPANGGWSSWGPYSSCSRTCGTGGTQTRHRTCTNPPAVHGGKACPGHSSQSRSCWNKISCPRSDCKDVQSYQFCRYVMMSYRCWQYYGYCQKTCNACNYHRAY